MQFFNVPSFINRPEYLYEAGAILVEGKAISGGIEKDGIGLLYKGEIIAFGTEAEVRPIFKRFAGMKGAKLSEQLEKMYFGIGKLPYGNSYLSKLALDFRKGYAATKHDGNIAVFAFELGGKVETKVFTTEADSEVWEAMGFGKKKPHAEEIGLKWLDDNKIGKVIAVYSELEPCMLKSHKCMKSIADKFPDATISFSYRFNNNPNIMKQAIIDRAIDLERIFKK